MPSALSIPEFDPEVKRPPFINYDLKQLQDTAKRTALDTLNATERRRANKNPNWDRALKMGASAIADDVAGNNTLIPAIQAEAMRAGVSGSLSAFGDTGTNLTPDSAATARVSTNLFGRAAELGEQVRNNRYRALQVGNQIFPDTQIGLSGQDAAAVGASNVLGLNSWNEANFKDDREDERLNWRVSAENLRTQAQQQNSDAAASAQGKAATQGAAIQGGAAIAGVAVLAIAL